MGAFTLQDRQRQQQVAAQLRDRLAATRARAKAHALGNDTSGPFGDPSMFSDKLAALPVKTTSARPSRAAQRSAGDQLRYLYENQPLDTGVGFIDKANRHDIEQNARAFAAGKPLPHKLEGASHVVHDVQHSALAKVTEGVASPLNPMMKPQDRLPAPFAPQQHREAGFGGALTYLGGNLLKDASSAALGFPAGMAMLAAHPVRGVKAIGDQYASTYGPIAHGDLSQLGQHPLYPILDASALAKVAAAGVGLEARVPMERKLSYDGGQVQPFASPNPVVRAGQHSLDRFSESVPTMPKVGARDRVVKRLPFEQEREFERTHAAAIPFRQARAALNKRNGEDMAFDVMYRYGDKAAADRLDQEIAMRQQKLADPSVTLTERRGQERTLAQLETARAHVAKPSPELEQALAAGRQLGDVTQQAKVDMGVLDPEQAAAREQMHSRMVSGGQFETTVAPSKTLRAERTYRDRLQGLYDRQQTKVTAAADKQVAKGTQAAQEAADALQAPPTRPRSREEAAQRLADLEAAHAGMLKTLEERVTQQPLAKADAEAQIRAIDEQIAHHQVSKDTADKVLAQLEADRPTLTQQQLAAKYGMMMDSGPTSIANKTFGARYYAASNIAGRRIRALSRERSRYVTAAKTGFVKIPHDAAETARRNLQRSKGANVPTLAEELRQNVEAELQHFIDTQPNHPVIKAHVARQAEIQQLRSALNDSHPFLGDEQRAADFGVAPDEAKVARLEQRAGADVGTIGNRVIAPGKVLTPTGGARLERLGGALSVSNDRVRQLEQAALRRQLEDDPTLLKQFDRDRNRMSPAELAAKYETQVPGQRGGRELIGGQEAPGARYMLDTSRLPTGSLVRRARSVTGKPQPLVKHSEGVLFEQGRARRGSRLLVEDFSRTARHRQQLADIKRVESFAKPLDPSHPGGLEPGYTYFNPEGVKLPRRFQDASEDELASMTPKEYAAAMEENRKALHNDLFPSADDLKNLPDNVRAKVKQVDSKIKQSLEESGSHGEALNALARVFDTTNNITKMGLIYLKGAYVPTNFAGNTVFLGIQQGPWAAKNLIRAVSKLGDLPPDTLHRIDIEVGGGGAHALAGEGKGLLAHATSKVADFSGILADRMPRRAAWLREAEKRGYKTPEQIAQLLHDPNRRHVLNQVSETAENAMVKFRGLTPTERRVVSRAIFIYPWMKGATRYAGRLALDRPVAAALSAHIGKYGADQTEKILGNVVSYLDGLVPVGKVESKFGSHVIPVSNPGPITPLGTAAQVGEAVGAALGAGPTRSALEPIQFASPVPKALVEAATHYDTFRGKSYPANVGAAHIFEQSLLGTPDRPNFPLVQAVKTAFTSPQSKPFTGAADTQPNYVQEGGIGAALKQAFLGSTRKRYLNLDAAQAKGYDERLAEMDPVKRATVRAQHDQQQLVQQAVKLGVISKPSDVPGLGEALIEEQQRQTAYAAAAQKAKVPISRFSVTDRMTVDLVLAVKQGIIDKDTADGVIQTIATLNPSQVKSLRTRLDEKIFPGSLIVGRMRQLVRHAGGKA